MLHNSLASLDSFREWLGLDQFPQIFAEYNASNVEDWSNCRLNDRASAVKEDIAKRSQVCPFFGIMFILTDDSEYTIACNKSITGCLYGSRSHGY